MGLPRPFVRLPALVLQHRGGLFVEPGSRASAKTSERLNPTKLVGQAKCDSSHFRDEKNGGDRDEYHPCDDGADVQVPAPFPPSDFGQP
jgi:hypothetical protein